MNGRDPRGVHCRKNEDEKYEFPANVNSYLRSSHRNLCNSKCCGGGGKFSILEYRYVAGAVDSLCPGYWICIRLDCA